MTEIKKTNYKEESFEFMQHWDEFGFSIGYQYSKGFDKPNLIYFTFAFWGFNFAW